MGKPGFNNQQRAAGRVFALTGEEYEPEQNMEENPAVIEGLLILYNSLIRVLFDTGASHSFISSACVESLGLESENLSTTLNITTPLGESVRVGLVCRDCELEIAGLRLVCDLRVMNMSDFDVILGMDWLFAHQAEIGRAHV